MTGSPLRGGRGGELGGGAGGSTAKTLKSTTAGRIALTSNANSMHVMPAKAKPGAATVMPVAMLARCGTESDKPGSRM